MQKDSLSEFVYQQVLELILTQQIKSGEKVAEEEIAKLLSVSRTPVREALRRLAGEGLILIYPQRFAEVVSFNEEDIGNIGVIRLYLDVLACQLAYLNGSMANYKHLMLLAEECEQLAKKQELYKCIRKDAEFHLYLTEISGNPLLLKYQKELYYKVCLILANRFTSYKELREQVTPHRIIAEALINRDKKKLLSEVFRSMKSYYNIEYDDFEFCSFS